LDGVSVERTWYHPLPTDAIFGGLHCYYILLAPLIAVCDTSSSATSAIADGFRDAVKINYLFFFSNVLFSSASSPS
jgi:hypothetical protein